MNLTAKKCVMAACIILGTTLWISSAEAQIADNLSFDLTAEESGACNDTTPCNEDMWLYCHDDTVCRCLDGMIVTSNLSTPCVSKIDNTCFLSSAKPMKCIDNAFCLDLDPINPNGTCVCNDGYLPEPNKETCKLGHRQECSRHADCNGYALLKCINQECVCSEGQIWDLINSKCLSTVENFCDVRDTIPIKTTCVNNADCDENICACKTNFKKTPTNECKAAYNQTCTTTSNCHPNFQCLGTTNAKTCGCDPVNQEYDPIFEVCNNFVGKPCNLETNPNCVENALCSDRTKTCICSSDFTQSSTGECVLGFDSDCAANPAICNSDSKLECNMETLRCDCHNGTVYDEQSRKCVGLPAATCTSDADCYELAICNNLKECECKIGYSATPENQCLLTHDQTCQGSNSCNPYEFLICDLTEQICTCGSTEPKLIYSEDKESCVSPPDGTCFLSERGGQLLTCVANATCTPDSEASSSENGICKCNDNFKAVDDSCVKAGAVGRIFITSALGMILAAILIINS